MYFGQNIGQEWSCMERDHGERVGGTDNVGVKERPVSLVLSAATIHCRVPLACSWYYIFFKLIRGV